MVSTRFPVAALLRAEPELRGCPVVVCESRRTQSRGRPVASPRDVVVGVSREAERLGAKPGMTVAQALVRHADLVVRPLDREAIEAGRAALLEVATSLTPRLEAIAVSTSSGSFEILLDVSGVERLFGSPAGIAAACARRAERVGFEVGVGIADGPSTARIAALGAARRGEAIVVAEGDDAEWLARLPLSALAPVAEEPGRRVRPAWEEILPTLLRLGVERVGDLARLPLDEVSTRFGRVGKRAWSIAAGRDPARIVSSSAPLDLNEGVELEYGMDSMESLLFVVRGLLDRLVARLEVRSLACRGLELRLALEDGASAALTVGVLAPTRDVKTLALLTRAAVEGSPPRAPIRAVRITAVPDAARPAQLDLFRPAGPPPERLATTLARLDALCGPGRVGRAVPPAGHRPDDMAVVAFAPPETLGKVERKTGRGWADPAIGLRAIRPAVPVEVYCEEGRIAYVRAPSFAGRTVVSSGPWRIETEWWTDHPCRRDYYDVQLSDGGVYRIYLDLGAREREAESSARRRRVESWFVDGCYD